MHTCSAVSGFRRSTTYQWLWALFFIAFVTTLTACGFRLKGASPLPFETLYTNISENSSFGANMRRAIVASSPHTRFVNDPKAAEARLIQLSNRQVRRELSIDAQGQVEEYELNLIFVFQLTDAQGRTVLSPTTLQATREIPYNPDDAQAIQGEISMIFNDMQQSMVARVVRHLSAPDVAEAFRTAKESPPVSEETLETTEPSDAQPAQSTDQELDWNTPTSDPYTLEN